MKGFLRRFVFSFNIIAIILLAGSYLSIYISPDNAWLFALLGLAYPFLLLLNIFFALFWLFQLKIRAIFSIVAMLAGFNFFNQTFRFNNSESNIDSDLKIISYNAGLFGYFQSKWTVSDMTDKVQEISPDLFCIQEFLNINREKTSTIDSIKKSCGFKYVYFQKLNDGRKKGEYGMAIFSKYPIESSGLVQFDGLTGNMCIYADIKTDSALLRVYNVHLQSFKFRKEDYRFVEKLPEDNDEKIRQSRNILKRMKYAYSKRALQVEDIKKHMETCGHEYFVIGDFNDPPVSYSYAQLSDGLKDAFVENGRGMGKTYIGIMPNFRIDYILFPDKFSGNYYKTYKLSSDHNMLSFGLKYKNE